MAISLNGTTGLTGNVIGNASTASAPLSGSQLAIQAAKAWVNFNGNFTAVTGQSYSRTSTTVTVTSTTHGLTTGNQVLIASATDSGLNGLVMVTYINANTFSFQTSSVGTATGTLSWTLTIRSSYNVSSITKNGTGDYTINFTNAMADANYSISGSCTYNLAGGGAFMAAPYSTEPSVSSCRIATYTVTPTIYDMKYINVAIFGN